MRRRGPPFIICVKSVLKYRNTRIGVRRDEVKRVNRPAVICLKARRARHREEKVA
jgi:hypothetical protein